MKPLILVVLVGLAVGLAGQEAAAQSVERIAFDYCDDYFYGIATCAMVVMDADGSNAVTVGRGTGPAWSPDGSRLWFAWDEVFVLDLRDWSVVTDPTAGDRWRAWSPDGSRLAFASDRDGSGMLDLYVMNADGSGVMRLTETGNIASYYEIAWSPGGDRITFTCMVDSQHICQVNADGTGFTRLTGPPGGFAAAWSPDGGTIAFVTSDGDIAVMTPDGSGVRRLTAGIGAFTSPTWSPDGSRIAFTAWTCDAGNCDSGSLWVVNVDGTSLACLTNGVLPGVDYAGPLSPAWSPGPRVRASAPPVITHTPIRAAVANNAITVTATITDDVGVTAATLRYGSKSGPWATVALTPTGTSYTGTMPVGIVTTGGIEHYVNEYYIEARDADGNVTRTPAVAPVFPYRFTVED